MAVLIIFVVVFFIVIFIAVAQKPKEKQNRTTKTTTPQIKNDETYSFNFQYSSEEGLDRTLLDVLSVDVVEQIFKGLRDQGIYFSKDDYGYIADRIGSQYEDDLLREIEAGKINNIHTWMDEVKRSGKFITKKIYNRAMEIYSLNGEKDAASFNLQDNTLSKGSESAEKINFTAIDFETATTDRFPCQLGLVVVRHGKIVEEKQFLIKPPNNEFHSNCIRVHGITPKDTADSLEYNELYPQIESYLAYEVVVMHNSVFDMSVMKKAEEYYKLPSIRVMSADIVCTMKIFNGRKLSEATEALGISMEQHHDALNDARACAMLYIEYLKGCNPDELTYPKHVKKPSNFDSSKLSADVRNQDLNAVINMDTVFYNKKVVITGTFSFCPIREELAQKIKLLGGDIKTSISSKTNIVCAALTAGPKKMEKVEQLNNSGCNIRIIREEELKQIINSVFD